MNRIGKKLNCNVRENRINRIWSAPALRFSVGMALAAALVGCAALTPTGDKNQSGFVQLPLIGGWHEGHRVHYITTDASDRDFAAKKAANFAPRLASTLPDSPQRPGERNALERIYAVTNFEQGNVLPSAPVPGGSGNTDKAYSPLWRMFKVTWQSGSVPVTLRSEEEVLAAAERGLLTIEPTDVVVNCPVVYSERGGLIPGATLVGFTH